MTRLAKTANVSRKFIYGQAQKADQALDQAFIPTTTQEEAVLFQFHVTESAMRQIVLSLLLHCHASLHGVQDFVRDIFDHHLSIGTIHNIAAHAARIARECNAMEDLSKIRVGAHDEIFQGDPVLVGVDPHSTYCYLLAQEPHRDGTTWGVHLLDLEERGLKPEHTIADAGKGLRAGQAEAWPNVPCWGDVFHAVREVSQLTIYLDNRAYGAIGHREKLERLMLRAKCRGKGNCVSKKLTLARAEEICAIHLAEDMRILADWLHHDVLEKVGPSAEIRCELFDFIVAEMRTREDMAAHRIAPVRIALENQRDDLLAFSDEIDRQLLVIAEKHQVAACDVRDLFENRRLTSADPRHWQNENKLRKQLGEPYRIIQTELDQLCTNIVRASSMVENINSRLRSYFFLRRTLGSNYLELLRFFLNHRRYPRSRKDVRVGKSPAEILAGRSLPHWLEQLGFTLVQKAS